MPGSAVIKTRGLGYLADHPNRHWASPEMKRLTISFSVAVVLVAVAFLCVAARQEKFDALAVGNFVVLTLTLLVLIWYAYDTNRIARATGDRWARESVLGAVYGLELVGSKGDPGRTLVRIQNPSSLVVRATVNCDLRVHGEPVSAGPLYDGTDRWVVFPQQVSQGWFEIDTVLQAKGKSVASLIGETTPANRQTQLTMRLSLRFEDELGSIRELPPRPHYFDFERWAWIPRLGEQTSVT